MKAVVQRIDLPKDKRVVCISDIHGYFDLFTRLLSKVKYHAEQDILILLGDFTTKGPQDEETLQYVLELSGRPGVHLLQGNCDDLPYLPHILETEDYIFVHGGIEPGPLSEQDAWACMKNDDFMNKGYSFEKYVVVGHWPTLNYAREIPHHNPVIDHEHRIISIDGGSFLPNTGGQLNAFMMENGGFSHAYVDNLPEITVEKSQRASGGTLNIGWVDRFVEQVEGDLYRHLASGKLLRLDEHHLWAEPDGRFSARGTDYYLPVQAGERVALVHQSEDRLLVKKNGVVGWLGV